MCYAFLTRKKALKDEIEPRSERVSMSRRLNAWIGEARNALKAKKHKHPEIEAQTRTRVRERLAG
jgi:hypothetical protein